MGTTSRLVKNDKMSVDEILLVPRPRALRLGPRTFMMAAVAALSVFDPGAAVTFGPWAALIVYMTGRPGRLRIDAPLILGLGLVLYSAASAWWSKYPAVSLGAAWTYAVVVVLFIATRDAIQTLQQLRTVAAGYLAGCAVLVYRLWRENAIQVTSFEGSRLDLGGLNVNYAGYAFTAGFAMIALIWATKHRTPGGRLWLAAAAASIVFGIVLSGTRGALIGLGLMSVWLLMCWAVKTPPIRMLVAAVLVGAAAITTGAVDKASVAFESMFGRATGDWSGRLIIWPIARDTWFSEDNLWFGLGAATFRLTNVFQVGAHNFVLEVGTGLGIVGVLLYVAILWASLGARPAGSDPRARILTGCFIAASAFSYLTGYWDYAPAAWVGVAVFSRLGLLGRDPAARGNAPGLAAKEPKRRRVPLKWLNNADGKLPMAQPLSLSYSGPTRSVRGTPRRRGGSAAPRL